MTNKYRPSDAEIEVASEILKEWGMEHGYRTAAVLALDAAGKVRAPKKMKKADDSEMLSFLEGVEGVVEATRNEEMHIHSRVVEMFGKDAWEEKSSGFNETIGFLDERPICISLHIKKIKGTKILFWHATSQLVDYAMISEWLKLNTPDNRTDALNWHNVLPR